MEGDDFIVLSEDPVEESEPPPPPSKVRKVKAGVIIRFFSSDPYPADQKSTDPILIHSLVKAIFTRHHSVNDAIQF